MQKLYADTQSNILELSMKQLTGNVRVSVQHCTGDEVIYAEDEKLRQLVEDPPTRKRYQCVDRKNSRKIFPMS